MENTLFGTLPDTHKSLLFLYKSFTFSCKEWIFTVVQKIDPPYWSVTLCVEPASWVLSPHHPPRSRAAQHPLLGDGPAHGLVRTLSMIHIIHIIHYPHYPQSWARVNSAETIWPCFQAKKWLIIALCLYSVGLLHLDTEAAKCVALSHCRCREA